ncbi:S-protein homolog 27-like [Macadamia integrifolia]|uniref:S-protein homolog 27-like n=1 Tax=Macadamia integrifolia TaxID=60698 RepID=UPI001C4FAF07|nr:S-protein homolog 27-like [Macadamia integrifolia]
MVEGNILFKWVMEKRTDKLTTEPFKHRMGGFRSIIPVLIIVAVMMEYSPPWVCGCSFLTPRIHVRVQNKLGEGKRLYLHCASRDDDLGKHSLDFNQVFTWTFCRNFSMSTIFYCDFSYARDGINVSTHGAVYYGERDECTDCTDLVQPQGVYVADTKNPSHSALVAIWP